ncbi:MAG TPA: RdgB/HAM1 family non-canonical purine NTP pyrophosphatase [Polyangiaceae bacterium]|nr:RdgB/HAM1 family non-canonical purine NTP pyrophosphatase [Polyangiaceae bacterium]
MRLLFATSNPHKVREVSQILGAVGIEVVSLDSLGKSFPEPDETAESFAAIAQQKAIAYAQMTGLSCLAEDSGLEVDALGGAPGVHSARYSGIGGGRAERDVANNQKLLTALQGVASERRTARFVCAMCVASPSGEVLAHSFGTMEGRIAEGLLGDQGFGYDPLLFLPELGKTSAQLAPEEKNARSHRGQAARRLAELLRDQSLSHAASTRA